MRNGLLSLKPGITHRRDLRTRIRLAEPGADRVRERRLHRGAVADHGLGELYVVVALADQCLERSRRLLPAVPGRHAAVDQGLGLGGDHVRLLAALGLGRSQRHAQHRLHQVVGEQRLLGAQPLESGANALLAGDGLAEQDLEQSLADAVGSGGGCSESAAR